MLKFSDGMELDPNGELRTVLKEDGWYVLGDGLAMAVESFLKELEKVKILEIVRR